MLRIAVFTEAGGSYGYGHLSRCGAILDGFSAFGFSAELFCRGEGRADWERDGAAFDGYDIVVIDSYTAAIDAYDRASQKAKVCVWLDDFCRLNYPKGIVHNCADMPILRKEFWNVAKKDIQKSVQNVFINLGSAPLDFDFESKAKEAFGEDINIIKLHNADAIGVRDAMQKADVAVSAAGQTLLELASMGVPSVAVITAQNQISNAAKLENIGFCKVVTVDTLDKTAEYLQSFCAAQSREISSVAGQEHMKEVGALGLAADALYALDIKTPRNMLNLDASSLNIKPFWSLDESERKELLSWRNNDSVRVRMFCKEPISWDEHIKFIETLKSDKTKSYWMVEGVGVISLSKIDFEELKADIGIYKAPDAPKGSGAKLLETLLDISFKLELKSVRADVYMGNAAAVKLYERFGFCFVGEYERDGTVAVYELKKEENIV
ncbi:MAG: UDP-4-amino-4,6-dideoxy-N-acetyl-beta-L-altrosamine N-acetyltransferase [Campylobacterales bacterium]